MPLEKNDMIGSLKKLQLKDRDVVLVKLPANIANLKEQVDILGSKLTKIAQEIGVRVVFIIYPEGVDFCQMDRFDKLKMIHALERSIYEREEG